MLFVLRLLTCVTDANSLISRSANLIKQAVFFAVTILDLLFHWSSQNIHSTDPIPICIRELLNTSSIFNRPENSRQKN